MNLKETIAALTASGFAHVCYDGWEEYLNGWPNPGMAFICEEPEHIVKSLGLTPYTPATVRKDHKWIPGDGTYTTPLYLYPKGQNVFPEKFESEMIISRVIEQNQIYTPDNDRRFWAMIYVQIIHNGQFPKKFRGGCLARMRERFGSFPRAKVAGIGWNCDPETIAGGN